MLWIFDNFRDAAIIGDEGEEIVCGLLQINRSKIVDSQMIFAFVTPEIYIRNN